MPLLHERHGAVSLLVMSRPEARNCWGADFFDGLQSTLAELADDDATRCVIITGDEAGKAFCAGANLKDPNAHVSSGPGAFIKGLPKKRLRSFPNVLADFPKPVLAAVNGYAVGAGCILAASCDLSIASDRAEWRLTQAALGIIPQHAATVRLARSIGRANAMKLVLGFHIKGEEALRTGLTQWLVQHEKLMAEAFAVAEHIARLGPLAVRMIKESMRHGLDNPSLADTALLDVYRAMVLGQTEDSHESHVAWRERRPPNFKAE